jgi:hypothetical protein
MRRTGAVFPDSIVIDNVRVVPDDDTAFTAWRPGGTEMFTSGVSPYFLPSM